MSKALDAVEREIAEYLDGYPPLLRPSDVEKASRGIVTAQRIYRRKKGGAGSLSLKVRIVGGRPLVAKQDLIEYLLGKAERPL